MLLVDDAVLVDSIIASGGYASFSHPVNSTDPTCAYSWQSSGAVFTCWSVTNANQPETGLTSTEPVAMTRTIPEDGDIGVREETREGTLVYVLHTFGSDQYVLRNRENAVAQAVRFAKRAHVRAWLADEGYDFELLVDFRVVESIRTHEVPAMARVKTGATSAIAADRSSKSTRKRSADVRNHDIARRAYDLFVARGCKHGHDLEDWLQAERELQGALSSDA
jgi:hypothetical protein